MDRPCSMQDFTQLAEALLSFHAWYKLGTSTLVNGKFDPSFIGASVAKMLAMLRWYCPRKKGNGWGIQKYHDLLHMAIDMQRFGPPRNFDAGPMESGLRTWAKLPAQTSQTRGYTIFAQQVAARTHEFLCFNKAMRSNRISGKPTGVTKKRNKSTPDPPQEDEDDKKKRKWQEQSIESFRRSVCSRMPKLQLTHNQSLSQTKIQLESFQSAG